MAIIYGGCIASHRIDCVFVDGSRGAMVIVSLHSPSEAVFQAHRLLIRFCGLAHCYLPSDRRLYARTKEERREAHRTVQNRVQVGCTNSNRLNRLEGTDHRSTGLPSPPSSSSSCCTHGHLRDLAIGQLPIPITCGALTLAPPSSRSAGLIEDTKLGTEI